MTSRQKRATKPLFVLAAKLANLELQANALSNLASVLARMNRIRDAVHAYLLALDIHHKSPNSKLNEASISSAVGFLQIKLGNYSDAIAYTEVAREIYVRQQDQEAIARVSAQLGGANLALNRIAESIRHFEMAITSYESIGNKHMVDAIRNKIHSIRHD